MSAYHARFAIESRGQSEGRHHVRIMTNQLARDGDIVDPTGMRVDRYLKNPVVMWVHDYVGRTPSAGLPIGRTMELDRRPEGIDVAFEFLPGDPFARRVENAWERGFLRTASIGWESLEAAPLPGGRGLRHRRSELLEWSPVPIPADPGASRDVFLAGMRSMGFGDLLSGEVHTGPSKVHHPSLTLLVSELEDAWDYLKARAGGEGVTSPRLREPLARLAGDITGLLNGPASTQRDHGDDTADAIDVEALVRAAERLRSIAVEL